MNGQIKSKQRVTEFGEVYTAKKQVMDMLSLMPDSMPINTTFLEPACGNGNFLAEIMMRKLAKAAKYTANEYLRAVITAVSSVYGVDIQNDNVLESRSRLLRIICTEWYYHTGAEPSATVLNAMQHILEKNIICGNTLTTLDSSGNPLVFCEWELTGNMYLLSKECQFSDMIDVGGECHHYIAEHKYGWLVTSNKQVA